MKGVIFDHHFVACVILVCTDIYFAPLAPPPSFPSSILRFEYLAKFLKPSAYTIQVVSCERRGSCRIPSMKVCWTAEPVIFDSSYVSITCSSAILTHHS